MGKKLSNFHVPMALQRETNKKWTLTESEFESFPDQYAVLPSHIGKLKWFGIHLSHFEPSKLFLHVHSPVELQFPETDPSELQLHSNFNSPIPGVAFL